jgi:two-component system, cell cycle sensor histidine kinase and response regulator CckA
MRHADARVNANPPRRTAMPRQFSSPASAPRAALQRARRAPLQLAALVFLVTLLITFSAWHSARQSAYQELESNFNFRAHDLSLSLVRRMAVYEQVLRGAQGYLRGSVEVNRRAFADYCALQNLEQHFPGIEALGVAAIIPPAGLARHESTVRREGFPEYAVHPAGRRPLYTAIVLIEPFHGRNLRAFGYDMFSEPVRRQAMEQARDSGRAAASGKVTLVQEGGVHVQSGFLMYLPLYRGGLPPATLAGRRAAIVGWVYAPFRMEDLVRGLGGAHSADLDIAIYDGTAAVDSALLYRSPGSRRPAGAALFGSTAAVHPGGRPWSVVLRSAPSFEASLDRRRPLAILLAGVGFGFLLSLVVWLLASERRRALALADAMTRELRKSRDRIADERQRMKVIIQNAYDAFIAIDPAGRVTDWNAQAAKLFGWSEQEALGKDIASLIVPEDQRPQYQARLRRFASSGTGRLVDVPTEIMALHRSGRLIPVELAIAALPTADGYCATAFVRDIAPRKQAEQRERLRQQRLDQTRAALQRSQKLEALGQMTGGVAHDFNNILHIISANVQLMLKAGSPHEKRLHNILQAVERGARLSAQLLAFARRQPLHPSAVNVARLIERMDSLLHRAAGDGVRVLTTSSSELWSALVDPNQLENVLLNLVINARDAMEGRGELSIRLENVTVDASASTADPDIGPGQYVLIAVSDTGAGMPPEVVERAFEPFFTTKPEGKGTGLGLSMAHGFVKQSGGHIRLASTVGQGTTVSIYLPRCAGDVASSAAPAHQLAG